MFCNAFHRQVSRVDIDGADNDIAVATVSVMHALIRMSGAEAGALHSYTSQLNLSRV